MAEANNVPSTFEPEMMIQYSAIGNDLRFYADQRFKIAGAFLVATGLLANVAKDERGFGFAVIGIVLSYLCYSWDRYTSDWWWALAATVQCIEEKGIEQGKLVKAYKKYTDLSTSHKFSFSMCRPWLRASQAMKGIYLLAIVSWAWWWHWALGVVVFIGLAIYVYNNK